MKFKSSAVDLTTFLAPRILSEGLFLYLGGKTFQDSSFTNKYDSTNIIENDGKKGEFMIYFNVGPF
ncbi:hypothetical protein B0679_06555 [Streptococcus mitis]|uniref:Uncharacterized protein n=1 Tax=Streptococcus mitis TaxID=28037 RepID=A0A1X1KTZ8_STRMT|nr:hypothetical protein B0679_06555 [Streptococcus mitis]ORO88937.1 hypothetical protein B7702_04640 [Streptococcus mitis]ORP02901.1 hypothetical protein B7693_05145 [Streptococcus mitis]